MIVVCAWCKKSMGSKPPLKDESTTHGMCPECYTREMKLNEIFEEADYLNDLDEVHDETPSDDAYDRSED